MGSSQLFYNPVILYSFIRTVRQSHPVVQQIIYDSPVLWQLINMTSQLYNKLLCIY